MDKATGLVTNHRLVTLAGAIGDSAPHVTG